MKKKVVVLGILLALVVSLAACGSDGGSEEVSSTSTLSEDYAGALPVSSQLAIGTLMLDGTADAVTTAQAGELLPIWQMLQALQSSGTAAPAELDAVVNRVQGAMTNEQLAAIQEMELTDDSMSGLVQELGLGRGLAGNAGGGGGFQPPTGMEAGGRDDAFGAGGNLHSKDGEDATAERVNTLAGTAMTGMVVSMLEARAEGETWDVATSN